MDLEVHEMDRDMNELQKEFEQTGYASWIDSDIYPDGKIFTKEYTKWLENKVIEFRDVERAKVEERPDYWTGKSI